MPMAVSEWGLAGVAALREHVAVLVIVDVLSFCTAVDVAVARGAIVHPHAADRMQDAADAAERAGALLAGRRAATDGYSLSPASLLAIPAGTRLLLPSPNGARLSLAGGRARVLAGCLRNAAAVAHAARRLAGDGDIGVIPAGESWPDLTLRPAIEDLLGAGAILHHLDLPCSPEARVARDAWSGVRGEAAGLIGQCVSGRELAARGFAQDVALAVQQNVSQCAPVLTEGAYRAG
jgi:2-phosphosulfolactate phosphatase